MKGVADLVYLGCRPRPRPRPIPPTEMRQAKCQAREHATPPSQNPTCAGAGEPGYNALRCKRYVTTEMENPVHFSCEVVAEGPAVGQGVGR